MVKYASSQGCRDQHLKIHQWIFITKNIYHKQTERKSKTTWSSHWMLKKPGHPIQLHNKGDTRYTPKHNKGNSQPANGQPTIKLNKEKLKRIPLKSGTLHIYQ